jgi:hypothetical protein
MPLLNGQAGSFDKLKKKANELGLVLSDDLIDSGVLLKDLSDDLTRTLKTLFMRVIAPVIPIVSNITSKIRELVSSIDANSVRKGFETIIRVISTVFDVFVQLGHTVPIYAHRQSSDRRLWCPGEAIYRVGHIVNISNGFEEAHTLAVGAGKPIPAKWMEV